MRDERVYELDEDGQLQAAVAARQVLSRIVNERIMQLSDGPEAPSGLAVVCECGNDGCFERIELMKREYDEIRANGTRFVLLPGHEIAEAEHVVERRNGYVVAERAAASGKRLHVVRSSARATLDAAPDRPPTDRLLEELEQAKTRNEQLELALQSRIAIEQAKGVLAERFGWSVETAFEVLRSGARSARMNIHQLARDTVPGEATPQPITAAIARGAGQRAADARRT